MNPLVSIITPTFNREDFIVETAKSILEQSYSNWEWIVVDDGSTDGTVDYLSKMTIEHSRIKVSKRVSLPRGACSCRNIGFRESKGSYVLFLDSDDLISPYCLEQRINAFQQQENSCDFIIFPSLIFNKKPYDLGRWWNKDSEDTELKRQLHQDAICQTSGVLWKRSAFERIGGWDESLFLWQDIDLFLRAFIEGYNYSKRFDLPPDFHHRINHQSMSRSEIFSEEKKTSRINVLKKAFHNLISNNRREFIRELRFMLAEIVAGLIRTKKRRLASELTLWGQQVGILMPDEVKLLKNLSLVYKFKLYKIKLGKLLIQKVDKCFWTSSSIGKFEYH